jgi:hypothetical protein
MFSVTHSVKGCDTDLFVLAIVDTASKHALYDVTHAFIAVECFRVIFVRLLA